MNRKDRYIFDYAVADAFHNDDFEVDPNVLETAELRKEIYLATKVTKAVTMTRSLPFYAEPFGNRNELRVRITPLGKELLFCMGADFDSILKHFPLHAFPPHFTAFMQLASKFRLTHAIPNLTSWMNLSTLPDYIAFVKELREACSAQGCVRAAKDQRRRTRKNVKSIKNYVDALFLRHSRLCVVRVDLHLTKAYRESIKHSNDSADPTFFLESLDRLVRYLDRKFPSYVGHALNLEYGPWRGLHSHLVIFFDGRNARADVALGELIGEHWKKVATNNAGSFFNCNRKKETFTKFGMCGLGTISYGDERGRANLLRTVNYLLKADDYLRLEMPGIKKSFRKGKMPTTLATRRGRPRQKKDSIWDLLPHGKDLLSKKNGK